MLQLERDDEDLSICPSFNSYSSSSCKITDIAIKVSNEFSSDEVESRIGVEEFRFDERLNRGDDDDDGEFEFAFVNSTDLNFSLEQNEKQFHQVFPVFNRDILLKDDDNRVIHESDSESRDVSILRIPLKNLNIDDRDVPSSSSSEIDELDGVNPESYCVWLPQSAPVRCKKSNSTGTSSKSTKLWSFRDLLRRSISDGKHPSLYLTKAKPEKTEQGHENRNNDRNISTPGEVHGVAKWKANENVSGKKVTTSAHEVFYLRNRTIRGGDKRRSYLPYRQDIVGIFANNINRFSSTKIFPPF